MGSYVYETEPVTPPIGNIAYIKKRGSKAAFQKILTDAEVKIPQTRSFSDGCRSRYHGYSRWLLHRAKFVTTRLRLTDVPDSTEVVDQGRYMCQEYIFNRLKKQNLLQHAGKMYPLVQAVQKPTDISNEIQILGHELERSYPDLYSSICKQLQMTVKTESCVKQMFLAVAEQMYKSQNTITWGKVVALYALAGALAADCVTQGHSDYISAVLDSVEIILAKYIAGWIVKQGGWQDIVRTFRTSKDTPIVWLLSIAGAVLGFVATLLATSQYGGK